MVLGQKIWFSSMACSPPRQATLVVVNESGTLAVGVSGDGLRYVFDVEPPALSEEEALQMIQRREALLAAHDLLVAPTPQAGSAADLAAAMLVESRRMALESRRLLERAACLSGPGVGLPPGPGLQVLVPDLLLESWGAKEAYVQSWDWSENEIGLCFSREEAFVSWVSPHKSPPRTAICIRGLRNGRGLLVDSGFEEAEDGYGFFWNLERGLWQLGVTGFPREGVNAWLARASSAVAREGRDA